MSQQELDAALAGSTPWHVVARQMHDAWPYRARAQYEQTTTHEFTTADDAGRPTVCVSSRVLVSEPLFLFVFTGDGLTKILFGGPPDFTITADAEQAKQAIQRIRASGSLTPDEFDQVIRTAADQENARRKYYEPLPVPLLSLLIEDQTLQRRASLSRKYDGAKLTLGMSAAEVTAMFGRPDSTRAESADETTWLYIKEAERGSCPLVVSLVFLKDRLKAVYSQIPWR